MSATTAPSSEPVEPAGARPSPTLSIIVKAWNEERHIGACLRSALAQALPLDGEVILADSLSSDRTVDIARQFDVRIVQLVSAADRGCGAALQLGYQFARGRYLYVLDADMTLEPGFLAYALAYLDAHPGVAAVGGRLRDLRLANAADRQRAARHGALREEQAVAALGGGGLYRRGAIEAVGYLAHRSLPACEEAELGARLRCVGWRLIRLARPALRHRGHDETTGQMLRRQWRNGRMQAYGMFLRSACGRPWLAAALKACWFVFIAPALALAAPALAGLASAAGVGFWPAWGLAQLAIWGAALGALCWRKKSWHAAALAFLGWQLHALAALRGFFRPLGDPRRAIPARLLQSARPRAAPVARPPPGDGASPTGK